MRSDSRSDSRMSANWSPESRASVSCGLSSRPSRRASVSRIEFADRDADRIVDLLEAVEIDHDHRRLDRRIGLGEGEHAFEPVDEQLAVGQAGQVVVHGVVQQPLLRVLEFGDVGERADEPHHLAVRADHRPRLEREPQIMAVGRAQAEVLQRAGRGAAPARCRARRGSGRGRADAARRASAPPEPSSVPRLRPSSASVSGLVKTLSAETSQSQIMSPAPVSASARRSTSETMPVVTPPAKACCITVKPISITISTRPPSSAGPTMSLVTTPVTASAGGDHPHHQQEPGRDQQHRAVEAVEWRDRSPGRSRAPRHGQQREPRDARRDRRIDQRDRDQHRRGTRASRW